MPTRDEYYAEIRALADDMKDEARSGDYGTGEQCREWLLERIHEMIDGHQFVIYTAHAQELLAISDNDGAYVENFGKDGLVDDQGCLNWSGMAYAAMEQDLIDYMHHMDGFDVNNPNPEHAYEPGDPDEGICAECEGAKDAAQHEGFDDEDEAADAD